jgi:hypothetical protein
VVKVVEDVVIREVWRDIIAIEKVAQGSYGGK